MLNLDLRILIEKNIKFSSFQRPKIHKFANNEYKKAINSGLNNNEANKVALDSTIAHFKNNIKYLPNTLFIFIISMVWFFFSVITVNSGIFSSSSLFFTLSFIKITFVIGTLLLICMFFVFPFFRTYDFLFMIFLLWMLIFYYLLTYSVYSNFKVHGGPCTIVSKSYFPGIFFLTIYTTSSNGSETVNNVTNSTYFSVGYLISLIPVLVGSTAFLSEIIMHKKQNINKNIWVLQGFWEIYWKYRTIIYN